MSENPLLRCAAPGILVAALCLLPFLHKAFTIDDPYFLLEAQQAVRTPLTPAALEICWDNIGFARPLRDVGSVGVVMSYLLVPVALLHGQEWVGHLMQVLLLCVAVIATVALAFRCGAGKTEAMLSGALFASFPAVLVMAGTIMPDILATTLGVIGIERLLAWKADGRLGQAWAAGFALGLAPLARSHTLLLLPIGIVMLVENDWPASLRDWVRAFRMTERIRWLPILIAVVCFFGTTWLTSDKLGGSPVFPGGPNTEQIGWQYVLPNLLQFGLNWMAVTPFAIAWLLLDGIGGIMILGGAVMGGGLLKFALRDSPTPLNVLGLAGLMAIGAAVVWAWRTRRVPLAGLGLCLLIALAMVGYVHSPSKYLAPCAPAASILLALRISKATRAPKSWSAAIVCVSAALGVTLLSADATFAGMARRTIAESIAPQIQAGHRAWYAGQWALTWYAEQAGATCLSIYPPYPKTGDLVVAGKVELGTELVPQVPVKLHLLQTIRLTEPGFRLMNSAAHAGFYSNGWGYLPWVWSREPVNTYYIWSVE